MRTQIVRRLAFVGLGLGLLAVWSGVLVGDVIEQVLVKVNGQIFTKTELELRQASALRQSGRDLDLANDPTGDRLRQALEQITPELLVNVVDEMLIVQRGMELGYRMGEEQFQSILENLKKDNNIETDEQLEAALKQENMTMAGLRDNLERQMIFNRVRQNQVMGIAVSEEEAERYYALHLDEFTTPPAVTLREIFVAVPGEGASPSVSTPEQAEARANEIRTRALAGESYEKLAADLSDAPSRANAGLIGPLSLAELAPEVRTLVTGLKVGEVGPIVKTPRGYQLLKLESMTEARVTAFAEARAEITDRVYALKSARQFQTFLDGLRSQAIIEWRQAEIQKAYERGLEELKAQLASAL